MDFFRGSDALSLGDTTIKDEFGTCGCCPGDSGFQPCPDLDEFRRVLRTLDNDETTTNSALDFHQQARWIGIGTDTFPSMILSATHV